MFLFVISLRGFFQFLEQRKIPQTNPARFAKTMNCDFTETLLRNLAILSMRLSHRASIDIF